MVCVTGLSVVPVSKAYNGFGQIVSMLLMQTGGLGLVSLIAISTYSLKNKLGLSDQDLLQSALSRDNQKDLKAYLFKVYKITFSIEALAALVIMTDFIPRFGLGHGIFNSLFLAVSAFCNAGFDNLGANSLQDYATNPTINLAVAGLIMSGSLGFAVWIDLIQLLRRYIKDRPRNWKLACRPFSNQSRLVLISTACILLVGTLLAWLLEMDNVKTIGSLNVWQQLMVSFFQTVTMRTAGFATISYTKADFSTNLLFMIQMIIGGGPGGTAGGIKVTTASIMFLLFKSELSGNSSVVFRNRIISNKTVLQAFTVILFFLTMLFVGYVILLETNPNLSPLALLFESVSAIATVGVSMDLTPSLNTIGRFVIMALMFIGRVGPITVLLSLMTKKEKQVSYSPTDISVG
jgi:Trk-type K+ transport system membrane component